MAKVFKITPGVENLGALKTGGQGSVYKGKRVGGILTAIKILPTPIYSETAADKNFISFQNEVEKLKRVNQNPNPHVVKILTSGITDTGNLPFIEMEYIEGPDLEELIQPPHEPVFSIKEIIKVADHLSNALAHCHNYNVIHGDIKSNNVKYDVRTNTYVLLDFGLAAMSDEQRRTSFRRAGAVEFMAPELSDGDLHPQTDIYGFGVIMFELIAGTVPFPLQGKSESARNQVIIAHLEKTPPDVLSLRREKLPEIWSKEKKDTEMQVPDWLVSTVYKCLEKNPENRFRTGKELQEHISNHNRAPVNISGNSIERIKKLEQENYELQQQRDQLQQQLLQPNNINAGVSSPSNNRKGTRSVAIDSKKNLFSSKGIITVVVAVAVIGLLVYAFVSFNNKSDKPAQKNSWDYKKDKVVKDDTKSAGAENVSQEVKAQLQNAKVFFNSGKTVESLIIYNTLSKQEVPEAMYYYAKLALQNRNENLTCAEAFKLLKTASDKGYIPAKRTLGFIYSFAGDRAVLEQGDYYNRCTFRANVTEGSKLLMEAMLAGDTAASSLVDTLTARQAAR